MTPTIFLGWSVDEMRAWNVAATTARRRASVPLAIEKIELTHMQSLGLYTRQTVGNAYGYYDVISQASMSTGHAIARFLVPHLCGYQGWALFCDGDVLFRADVADLFALADDRVAVQVVQHDYAPTDTAKKSGAEQTRYLRKNWSSVMLFNCGHPANRALTVSLVNTVPGRDLHRFCWLEDALIGALPARWNFLVGHSTRSSEEPAIVHFTAGVPDVAGHEHDPFADEWYDAAFLAGYRLTRPQKPDEVPA